MNLHEKSCKPCRGGVPTLSAEEIGPLFSQLDGWRISGGHHLEKEWSFEDFAQALDFVNGAGLICEEQGHHADFELGWGRASARIWTHKIDGLTESDFVLAAKLDRIR
jgi:4a-hydroxytetrahydrobiopterin dehydratase